MRSRKSTVFELYTDFYARLRQKRIELDDEDLSTAPPSHLSSEDLSQVESETQSVKIRRYFGENQLSEIHYSETQRTDDILPPEGTQSQASDPPLTAPSAALPPLPTPTQYSQPAPTVGTKPQILPVKEGASFPLELPQRQEPTKINHELPPLYGSCPTSTGFPDPSAHPMAVRPREPHKGLDDFEPLVRPRVAYTGLNDFESIISPIPPVHPVPPPNGIFSQEHRTRSNKAATGQNPLQLYNQVSFPGPPLDRNRVSYEWLDC